jgi:Interferon-induced 6-16 family
MLIRQVPAFPCIEKKSTGEPLGELCFISSVTHDRRIQCNVSGRITMDRNWLGWEVWRLTEKGDGNVFISSWTHSKHFLSSDAKGNVFTTKNQLGWEVWKIEKETKEGVIIHSVQHNRRLCFDGKHLSTIDPRDRASSTAWNLEEANRKVFSISCVDFDKRIRCPKNEHEPLRSTHNRQDWEKWEMTDVGEGRVVFRSKAHGLYLGVNDSGALQPSRQVSDRIYWRLEESSKGLSIISVKLNRRIRLDESGNLGTVPIGGDDEKGTSWSLEPRLPMTISWPQIGVLVGGGLATLGLAMAAPFAIMGVVTSMGFTSAGIVGGSTAAGMMSAEAIAAGGGVVAGGTVATLQSIGAVGLGVVGTTAAVGGGAVVGSGVSAAVIAGSGVMKNNSTAGASEASLSYVNRPFCAWTSW